MKKKDLFVGILALVLAFGIVVTGCDNGDTSKTPAESVIYTSTDSSGNTYTLTVTANTDRATYAEKSGDSYELKIAPLSGTTKISRGTVESIDGNGSLALKPSNAATTFSITVSGGSMTAISGTITLDDGEIAPAPTGVLIPRGDEPENTDPKSITITGISGKTGQVTVSLWAAGVPNPPVGAYSESPKGDIANGVGTISSGSVTVSLKNDGDTDWTSTGFYDLSIYFHTDANTIYIYTNNESSDKIRIAQTTTTVAFNKFDGLSGPPGP
jgi:hypothetical protein